MALATKEKELITIWNENGLKAKLNSNGRIITENIGCDGLHEKSQFMKSKIARICTTMKIRFSCRII